MMTIVEDNFLEEYKEYCNPWSIDVLEKDLFSVLRGNLGSNLDSFFYEKVIPIHGDVSCENLGVQDITLRKEIWKNTDIVVNCAATTDFDERYDVALAVNTMGALNVLNFAKNCPGIIMLLHVSTAYVCGKGTGLIMEKPFCMGESLKGTCKLDIGMEKKLVDEKLNQLPAQEVAFAMKDLGLKRAKWYGWPNTYVFTKAMGEMLLGSFRDNLPLVIIRPTMITSTFKEPFPGYIEGLRTIDAFIATVAKGRVNCFLGKPETILDVIPADMVVNSMLMAMCAHAHQCSDNVKIYHVGSSLRNPLKISNIHDIGVRYFTQNPWINRKGKPVRITKVKFLGSMARFRTYMTLRYVLPLKGLGLVNAVFGQHSHAAYENLHRSIKLGMRLVELYEPYLLFKGIFDDTNSESLRMEATEDDGGFDFNPKCINWEDYFFNIHIPGLRKYVMTK
ncbi:hypothetical protein SLEP1_g57558 [Rubroshorea leprosula]|uniref:Fatty acyl-CoA reductase n=1 Tax=Rubroshorea leprosula TaxID=152421 RepID=A0AAV5MN99_9ROSI|nr:hypothetical protein SLEP1_g57558 [Rubroshorea leprosula]